MGPEDDRINIVDSELGLKPEVICRFTLSTGTHKQAHYKYDAESLGKHFIHAEGALGHKIIINCSYLSLVEELE